MSAADEWFVSIRSEALVEKAPFLLFCVGYQWVVESPDLRRAGLRDPFRRYTLDSISVEVMCLGVRRLTPEEVDVEGACADA